jgi:hypothetical protein
MGPFSSGRSRKNGDYVLAEIVQTRPLRPEINKHFTLCRKERKVDAQLAGAPPRFSNSQ